MARLRHFVFVSYMLALLSAAGCDKIWDEHAERPMENSSKCNVTGPISHTLVKMWLKESNETIVCKPCRMKYQTYVNCSKCSIAEDPVCDDQGLRKVEKDYLINPYQPFPKSDYLPLISQLVLFRTNASQSQMEDIFQRNLIYSIHAISHSPFFTFLIDNCGSSSKHFTKFERNLVLRAMDIFKMSFSELFSMETNGVKMMHKPYISDYFTVKQEIDEMDQILHKLCESGVVSKKHKKITRSLYALNGINSRLPPLKQRRDVYGSEDDNLFKITNKVSETPEKRATTRLHKKYKHRSKMDVTAIPYSKLYGHTVTAKDSTKHFRRIGNQSAGKKRPHRVRGKKHRDFSKNLKHNNGNINFHSKVKSSDLDKGSHLNKTVFDKKGKKLSLGYNNGSTDDSYEKSDKVSTTYIESKNGDSSSEISTDVSVTSSFSIHMGYTGSTTEAPWGMNSSYYQQFSEQTSQNSSANDETQLDFRKGIIQQEMNKSYNGRDEIEHDIPSQLEYGKPTELDSSYKLSSTAENSGMESSSFSNVFRGFTSRNDTPSDYPVDSDMSSTGEYRKDLKTAETPYSSDHTAVNTSSITLSSTLEEVTVNSFENLEHGVKNTDVFINMSSSATGERLVATNSLTTSKQAIIANELDVRNHTDRKFLLTSLDQGSSNYVTGQYLFNSASSGRSTDIGETVKENSSETVSNFKGMPLGNISEEQEGLKNLSSLDQDKNHDNVSINYRSEENNSKTLSTIPSSLPEHDFSLTTESKIPDIEENGDIAVNVNKYTDSIETVPSELQNRSEEILHSSTSRENEKRDTEIGNSRNLTHSSHISFTRNGTEEYLTEKGADEYKLEENQTLETSQIEEIFSVVTPNFPDQQQQNLTSNTFTESGDYRNNVNFRRKQLNFNPTNKNDINQALLETSEHTLGINRTKERNTTGTLYNRLENVESHVVNNTSDELKGNNRSSDITETNHGDNLYRYFTGNENKGLSFSYERVTKSDEKNGIVGFKSNHLFNPSSTILPYISGELSKTSSKESISDYVDELNFRSFNDSEVQKTLSEHSIDHANSHGLYNYRTTRDDDDGFKSSSLNGNQANDRGNNGMKESYDLESIPSNIRYKRDQLVTKKGSKSIQINEQNSTGGSQDRNVLFIEELPTPLTMINSNSKGYHKDKYIHIPKKSNGDLRSSLNSSDLEKNQEILNNGTTKKVETADKKILKSKNLRKKYKSQNAQNVNEFSTVTPNFKKDHNDHPKSTKARQYSYGHSTHIIKKQLENSSPHYEKNQSVFPPLKKLTESTKHNLSTNENGVHSDVKGMSVKQNLENSYPKSRQQYLLKENPKDTLLEKANNAGNEFIDPKFRTGRKLLRFSGTGDKKLIVNRFGIPLFLRRRRSGKDLPESSWCNLPDGLNFKRVDCTVWTYQKKCLMSCNSGNNGQGAKETIYTCARKKNVWEPKIQSCADDGGGMENIDSSGYQPAKENKKNPVDSNKSGKSQATKPPSDYNSVDYYEYEDYQYQEDEGNRLSSDKKSGGQKKG